MFVPNFQIGEEFTFLNYLFIRKNTERSQAVLVFVKMPVDVSLSKILIDVSAYLINEWLFL